MQYINPVNRYLDQERLYQKIQIKIKKEKKIPKKESLHNSSLSSSFSS